MSGTRGQVGSCGQCAKIVAAAVLITCQAAFAGDQVVPRMIADGVVSKITVVPRMSFPELLASTDTDRILNEIPSWDEAQAWRAVLGEATDADIDAWLEGNDPRAQAVALYVLSDRGDYLHLAKAARLLESEAPSLGVITSSSDRPGESPETNTDVPLGFFCQREFYWWFGVRVTSKAEFEQVFGADRDLSTLAHPKVRQLARAIQRSKRFAVPTEESLTTIALAKQQISGLPENDRWAAIAEALQASSITPEEAGAMLETLSTALKQRLRSGEEVIASDPAYSCSEVNVAIRMKNLRTRVQSELRIMAGTPS